MSPFLWVDLGVGISVLYLLLLSWWYGHKAVSAALEDLKRLGYQQISIDGMRIRMRLGGRRGNLEFRSLSFEFRLALELNPRHNKEGYEWRPYAVRRGGGRNLVGPGEFAAIVHDTVKRSNDLHSRRAVLPAEPERDPHLGGMSN